MTRTAIRAALVAAATIAAAAPVATAAPAAKGPKPVAPDGDRLIVAWRASAGAAHRASARAAVDARLVHRVGTTGADLVTVPSGTAGAALDALRDRADVRYAEADRVLHALRVPNDPGFASLWGMTRIGAPQAWDTATDASSVIVGVTDTGVALDHPDLVDELWHNAGETGGGREANGLDDDRNGFVDDVKGWDFAYGLNNPYDNQYHGTHVAGTIGAAGDNGRFVTGVAWRATLMPVAVLDVNGEGFLSDIAAGFDYAASNGARIVNASLGGSGSSSALFRDVFTSHPETLFVVAAGNETSNNDVTPQTPCVEPNLNVLCVAATDKTDGLASFSNYGRSTVDVAAPGQDILSTIPGDGTEQLSGTSMATPMVTGVAALTLAQHPWLSTQQLKTALLNGARALPPLRDLTVSGAMIDAPGALNAARDTVAPSAPAVLALAGGWSTTAPAIRWTPASDGQSGLAGYDVDVDGRRVASVAAATTTLALGPQPDGTHTVVVSARDNEGNRAPSAGRAFGTDATPPVPPAPKTPAPGAVLRTPALLFTTAPATDAGSGVGAQALAIDGRAVAVDAFGRLTGAPPADGPHTWTTSAVDTAGNAATSAPVAFTIDNAKPSISILRRKRVSVVPGGVTFELRASEPVNATVTLSATGKAARRLHLKLRRGSAELGHASLRLGAASHVRIGVKKATLKRLRRAHGLRLRLTVVATDAAGNRQSVVLAGVA